ncbi:hypothetical protein [Flavobacterium seoulense]|uniref:DUF3325 domain-containing protein n=1 Tax=Flavobacterium seoulense TaxID=1492738 RepID=A0A066WVN6_9FLAO|nr:hypothetical protein [Flavobacterium seoulense]KDN56658.1 hypothetical protein FEM21_01610 [Flavobacterium seoulense]
MITLVSLIVFLAFFVLYNTSKKATLATNFQAERWIQQNPKPSRFIGLGLLLIAYILLLSIKAAGVSSFLFLIQIMTIGSLVVILAPLKIINYKLIIGIICISTFLEIYL